MTGRAEALAPLQPAGLADGLTGTRFAGRAELRGRIPSTIDECRRLADAGAPEGAFVIAEGQSRGRGQGGRAWHSPDGVGLYLSVLLRPPLPAAEAIVLTTLAGLAACETVREDLGLPAVVKAPNDLWLPAVSGWRKLAGVLIDTAIQGDVLRHAIVSLGLNVDRAASGFPAPLEGWATSLGEELDACCSREQVACGFLRRLEATRRAMDEGWPAWLEDALARARGLTRELGDLRPPELRQGVRT